MSDFKSRKAIIAWLEQGGIINSNYGSADPYYYKLIDKELCFYYPDINTWLPCWYKIGNWFRKGHHEDFRKAYQEEVDIASRKYPCKAWVNQPSALQPLHKYHGKIGIAVKENETVTVYFTEGEVYSMVVPENCLEVKYE